jgi:hypothetical protein
MISHREVVMSNADVEGYVFDSGPPPHPIPEDTVLVSHYAIDVGMFTVLPAPLALPSLRLVTMGVTLRDRNLPGDHIRMDTFVIRSAPLVKRLRIGTSGCAERFVIPVEQTEPTTNVAWPTAIIEDDMLVHDAAIWGGRMGTPPLAIFDARQQTVKVGMLVDVDASYISMTFTGPWIVDGDDGTPHKRVIHLPATWGRAFGNRVAELEERFRNSADLTPLHPFQIPSGQDN